MAPKPSSSKSKTKAPALPTPARLLLRIHSAKGLHYGVFSHGVYCKMYVGETAMLNGSDKGLFGGKSDTTNAEHSTYKVFRTKTIPQPANAESDAVWDENFDVYVPDTTRDILSIRVKSKHRLYPSVLGVCAVQLKQLKIGHSVDKWVALHKGTREVATLRLQIVLSPIVDPQKVLEGSKPDLQADIKTALAANQSAEEAIERLLASGKFSNRGGTVIVFDNEDNRQTSTTETQTEQLQEQPSKVQEKTEELQPKKHEDNQQTSTTETHTKQVQEQPIKGQEKSEELKKNGTTTSIEHVPVVPTAFST